MCKFHNINRGDIKIGILEEQLREIGIMSEEEAINGYIEMISFDDTLGEMEKVIKSKLQVNKMIPINFVALYTVINYYEQGVAMDEVEVNTKNKTVDKKVKPVATPLPEDHWQ